MESTACIDASVKVLKFLSYIFIFTVVLGSAVVSKGTLLFITSQLKKDKQITHCNRALGEFCYIISLTFYSSLLCSFYVTNTHVFGITSSR